MLSRTADALFWMGRYIERAENNARVLDVAHRLSLLPSVPDTLHTEWSSVVSISGSEGYFASNYGGAVEDNVVYFLTLDRNNPSSIYSCIRAARENCRSIRHAIPSEVWEAINATWFEVRDLTQSRLQSSGLKPFFDWVKERSSLYRGTSVGTMLQDEAFHFTRLGTFLERGDNTARILDVKYHVILPQGEQVGGATDYYQWGALLRSVSAFRNYRSLYGPEIRPYHVAELLTIEERMPRSLLHCQSHLVSDLENLAQVYGVRHECHRLSGETHAKLKFSKIEHIFHDGLHEFLEDFVDRNAELGYEIADNFLLTR